VKFGVEVWHQDLAGNFLFSPITANYKLQFPCSL